MQKIFLPDFSETDAVQDIFKNDGMSIHQARDDRSIHHFSRLVVSDFQSLSPYLNKILLSLPDVLSSSMLLDKISAYVCERGFAGENAM